MRTALARSTTPRRKNYDAIRLAIEYVVRQDVRPKERQVRKHGQGQIRRLAQQIEERGFLVPLIVDENGGLVTGYARLAAAELLQLERVPIVRISHLTEAQLRLFAIFDNKIAEGADWDEAELHLEFEELRLEEPSLDLTSSGFEIGEIDMIAGRARTALLSDLDEVREPGSGPPTTVAGDLWLCGKHRLLCGNSTDAAAIQHLTDGRPVRQHLSDPPFDLPMRAFSSGMHPDFAMGAGEMGAERFTQFLTAYLQAASPVLMNGALVYAFMDHRHIAQLLMAGTHAGLSYVNLLVWVKGQAGQGSFYRSGHELVGVFRHGDAAGLNNIKLGAHGRNRSNVLSYPGVRGPSGGGAKALAMHPTVKNVAMIADLLLDASAPGDVVLDSFGGSGTTMIAAERTDRVAHLCELSPAYVDTAVQRFQALTGTPARLLSTGATFADVAAERCALVLPVEG